MIVFCESFDDRDLGHIPDRYEEFRMAPTGNARLFTGRTGTGLILSTNQVDGPFPDYIEKYYSNRATVIVGIATNSPGDCPIISIRDNGTPQVFANLNVDGTVSVWRGSSVALLGTSVRKVAFNTWFYTELKATIDPVAGSFYLNIDGEEWLSGTGVNTSQTGNAYGNQTRVIMTSTTLGEYSDKIIDDFYIADTSTDGGRAVVSDFAGPVKIACLLPDANGATNDWSAAGAASQYQCVDETTGENGDTDYVKTATYLSDSTQLFGVGDFARTPGHVITRVQGVVTHQWAKRTDALGRQVAAISRPVSTVYEADAQSLDTNYGRAQSLFEKNPETSARWTVAQVNAAEFGMRAKARV